MKFLFAAVLASLATLAWTDDITASSHYASIFFGRSALIFGSQEIRQGGGISYAYGRAEPRFQIGRYPAQLVYEGYYDHTHGDGGADAPTDTDAFGFLAYGRWWGAPSHSGYRFYGDLGWGFQYATKHSFDLDSLVNSTPMLDLGIAMPAFKRELMFGVRYLHISNAGTVKPNRGQNEIFLTASIRF